LVVEDSLKRLIGLNCVRPLEYENSYTLPYIFPPVQSGFVINNGSITKTVFRCLISPKYVPLERLCMVSLSYNKL